MKKSKIILSVVALLTATGAALALKAGTAHPVDLYYFNSEHQCVTAPCETMNNTDKPCLMTAFTDSNCKSVYRGNIWTTEGD